jgi:hypothetical protein
MLEREDALKSIKAFPWAQAQTRAALDRLG